MVWTQNHEAWVQELGSDRAYEEVVTPLLLDVLEPAANSVLLDMGSGEGRVVRRLRDMDVRAIGLDINLQLARRSRVPTVVAELPDLRTFRIASFDGAYSVLSVEHIEDLQELFGQTAQVVRPSGVLAFVLNHPIWTAPGSTPITDTDGEVLWRPGSYFSNGATEEPLGDTTVTFHHRPVGELLSRAAASGWSLERLVEVPHHEYQDQSGIPRLLACRWRLLP